MALFVVDKLSDAEYLLYNVLSQTLSPVSVDKLRELSVKNKTIKFDSDGNVLLASDNEVLKYTISASKLSGVYLNAFNKADTQLNSHKSELVECYWKKWGSPSSNASSIMGDFKDEVCALMWEFDLNETDKDGVVNIRYFPGVCRLLLSENTLKCFKFLLSIRNDMILPDTFEIDKCAKVRLLVNDTRYWHFSAGTFAGCEIVSDCSLEGYGFNFEPYAFNKVKCDGDFSIKYRKSEDYLARSVRVFFDDRLDTACFGDYCFADSDIQVIDTPCARLSSTSFRNCKKLRSVTFREGSSCDIVDSAFTGCTSLQKFEYIYSADKNINFHIARFAFSGCTSLEEVAIPVSEDGSFRLDNFAFFGCYNLKRVVDNCPMPSSGTPRKSKKYSKDWGVGVFFGCYNLEEIDLRSVSNASALDFVECLQESLEHWENLQNFSIMRFLSGEMLPRNSAIWGYHRKSNGKWYNGSVLPFTFIGISRNTKLLVDERCEWAVYFRDLTMSILDEFKLFAEDYVGAMTLEETDKRMKKALLELHNRALKKPLTEGY